MPSREAAGNTFCIYLVFSQTFVSASSLCQVSLSPGPGPQLSPFRGILSSSSAPHLSPSATNTCWLPLLPNLSPPPHPPSYFVPIFPSISSLQLPQSAPPLPITHPVTQELVLKMLHCPPSPQACNHVGLAQVWKELQPSPTGSSPMPRAVAPLPHLCPLSHTVLSAGNRPVRRANLTHSCMGIAQDAFGCKKCTPQGHLFLPYSTNISGTQFSMWPRQHVHFSSGVCFVIPKWLPKHQAPWSHSGK